VAKGEIIWSHETYRIYEIDPALPASFDLVGTRIHPEEASWFQDLLGRASSEGRDLEFEHRLQMPDQSVKYLHVVAHATRDQDGQLEYIGAVQDVTERRRSEDALNKLRSELAHMGRVTTLGALTASIAHEVNQPLSGIITNASTSLLMLADDPPDIAGAVESAERTIRDANRASEVIARLRALFKKTSTARESLNLNEATREVLALSVRELQRAQVMVRTELADDVPPVLGDRVQLQQVVLNLVLNAVESMSAVEDRPRQLVVRTERDEGDHVRLIVQDTGLGLDSQNSNRLFETFYTTKRDGMGVGLSISRSIIESHQGRLWAITNDGPGATFAFSIPRLPVLGRARKIDDPPIPTSPHLTGVEGAV
jgi:C4-dicarboxylate-specific signal transduction histidine kinase